VTPGQDDQTFGPEFDRVYGVGPEPGNQAFFGRDVLRGLIDGIDDFVKGAQPRWKLGTYWRYGPPALLGCSPWVTDDELIERLRKMPACVVMTKLQRRDIGLPRLRELNENSPGMELRALRAGLGHIAPKVEGKPDVIGPYSQMPEFTLSTIRALGFREAGRPRPRVHAKLAVLGTIAWTDEHPAGGVDDYIWFSPRRLWVSSANFTFNSRRGLEFGYWTEDEQLIEGATNFLVSMIGASEDLGSAADSPDPELAEVEYDDVAMAEALAEMSWDDEAED
jgi:hypothetical protein